MSVWCWGLTSHRTGRLSNDMWHVPWCHRQRQAPQADGWAVDWSDYMPFRSPPLVPIVLLQSLFCSQLAGRMLAARCRKQAYISAYEVLLWNIELGEVHSQLFSRMKHIWLVECRAWKYVSSPPAWPAIWAKKPKLFLGKPKLRRVEAVREEEEGSKGFG